MANHRAGRASGRGFLLAACATAALAASACGREPAGSDRLAAGATETRTSALNAREADRAAYYATEATRYHDLATQLRRLSAVYARWHAPATASKDWNAALKEKADARAAAADQIAAGVQTLADFHAARAGAR